jgi:hypothetical protein
MRTSAKATAKGSISEMMVPMPMSFTYFCAKAMMSGKYGSSGVRMLVYESPMR